MAAAGYTPISLYYSSTTTNVPTNTNLVAGELAINTADGKLFYKDSSNVVQTMATKGTAVIGGSNNQIQYNSSGSLAGSAGLTFDGTNFATTGTVSGTKLIPTGGAVTGNGMYLPAANAVSITTNGADRVYIDSSGNVGIGVTPSAWANGWRGLQNGRGSFAWSGTGAYEAIQVSSNAVFTGLGSDSNTASYIATDFATNYRQRVGQHQWFNAPSGTAGNAITFTQAMTLDASGDLRLGTTTALWANSGRTVLTVNGSSQALVGLAVGNTTKGYMYHTGTDMYVWNEANGFLSFATNNTERARITSGGLFGIGTTSPAALLTAVWSGNSTEAIRCQNGNNVSGDFSFLSILGSNCNNTSSYHYIAATGTTDKYYIYGNGTTGTPSDIRLKKNIETARNGYLEDLTKLRIVKYNWKTEEDNTPKELGVIAQEVEQVFPGIVSTKVDEQTGEETKAVKHSVFVPMLLKAVQELKAINDAQATRIETLEAQNAAFEARLAALEAK